MDDLSELKRGLPGYGTDSFMENYKCRFCGLAMDEYAETFDDGEYTRSTAFQCTNSNCSGPLFSGEQAFEYAKKVFSKCAKWGLSFNTIKKPFYNIWYYKTPDRQIILEGNSWKECFDDLLKKDK